MKKNTTLIIAGSLLIWISSLVALTTQAVNISNNSLQSVTPILRKMIFKQQGSQANTTGVILDGTGIYINLPQAINVNAINVLKLNGSQTFEQGIVNGSDIATWAIGSNHIVNYSITNNNFVNNSITNINIANNTITITKFDPLSVTFPTGGAMYWYTPTICAAGYALTGIVGGTSQCAPIVGGAGGALPNCGVNGQVLSTSATGALICITPLLSSAVDPYWSWYATGTIWNKNLGNVGFGITNPLETIHVRDRFRVDYGSSTSSSWDVYCDALGTRIALASFTIDSCAICPVWYIYNSSIDMCEDPSCSDTGCIGVYNRSATTLTAGDLGSIPQCSCDLDNQSPDCAVGNSITADYPTLPWLSSETYATLPAGPIDWLEDFFEKADFGPDCYDQVNDSEYEIYHRLWYNDGNTTCGSSGCDAVYNEGLDLLSIGDATAFPQCTCDLGLGADCHQDNDVTADYPTLPRLPNEQYNLPYPIDRTVFYFVSADVGEECYDQIDDSTAAIYHRLWYNNGDVVCDSGGWVSCVEGIACVSDNECGGVPNSCNMTSRSCECGGSVSCVNGDPCTDDVDCGGNGNACDLDSRSCVCK